MKNIIFDQTGTPSLSLVKGKYLFSLGDLVYAGYVEKNKAHDFNGSQRGWFDEGILRDLTGKCVGFVEGAAVNSSQLKFPPTKPVKKIKKLPTPPLMPVSQEKPFHRPAFKTAWSNKKPIDLMIP